MRLLCAILICFIAISLSFAGEEMKKTKKLVKLIYSEDGYLINAGEEDLL